MEKIKVFRSSAKTGFRPCKAMSPVMQGWACWCHWAVGANHIDTAAAGQCVPTKRCWQCGSSSWGLSMWAPVVSNHLLITTLQGLFHWSGSELCARQHGSGLVHHCPGVPLKQLSDTPQVLSWVQYPEKVASSSMCPGWSCNHFYESGLLHRSCICQDGCTSRAAPSRGPSSYHPPGTKEGSVGSCHSNGHWQVCHQNEGKLAYVVHCYQKHECRHFLPGAVPTACQKQWCPAESARLGWTLQHPVVKSGQDQHPVAICPSNAEFLETIFVHISLHACHGEPKENRSASVVAFPRIGSHMDEWTSLSTWKKGWPHLQNKCSLDFPRSKVLHVVANFSYQRSDGWPAWSRFFAFGRLALGFCFPLPPAFALVRHAQGVL